MIEPRDAGPQDDPFALRRFVTAQADTYDQALAELRRGQKRSHWMWFIFPQIAGLGRSATPRHFAIKSSEEARQYLVHPVLGPRLRECAQAVLALEARSAAQIFGSPDDMKLHSSMTLFAHVAGSDPTFRRVLERYFNDEMDHATLRILEQIRA